MCTLSSSNNPERWLMTQDGQQGAEIGYQGHRQKRNARRCTSWKEILNAISTESHLNSGHFHLTFINTSKSTPLLLYWGLCKLGYGAYVLRARLSRCTDWIHTSSVESNSRLGEEGGSRLHDRGNRRENRNRRNWTSVFRAWYSRCTDRIHASFFHCRGHDRNIHESKKSDEFDLHL